MAYVAVLIVPTIRPVIEATVTEGGAERLAAGRLGAEAPQTAVLLPQGAVVPVRADSVTAA